MLRCEDNSIYTGITIDIDRRMEEHFNKNEKCAKYTLNHTAKKLENVWKTEDRALASKLEYAIKKLKKIEKESLIQDNKKFEELFSNRLDCEKYIKFYKGE